MHKIRGFRTPADFRVWLEKNHHRTDALGMRIFKKASGRVSITYAEALDEALCYGWIDGLKLPHDELSFVQRFTQRRAKSGWSKINTKHVERLTREGRMRAPGQAAVDAARNDGRWEAAYDSGANATIPADLLRSLDKNKKARAFFDTLNKANRYAIVYRLQTAKKAETRARRMQQILAMMARGEKFH